MGNGETHKGWTEKNSRGIRIGVNIFPISLINIGKFNENF